ncbi:MAG: protein kinase [Candidatus Latescibacteria bacterium]|nr:protein kinase [Candidatus Latescibacterota bacterium]NIO29081.1 protein kinase [Candidatus Latescibacterota bacterium]NIO56706.1 protein kinase [Candidatus Latescibacterota bacterium]NIT02289.1 protein kinase [Candidatus Latescibacterota bacterium]NIT39174.1 protein kinase [Candidatus Latescibacterota bacterium]
MIGTVIAGKYKIEKKIGEGGFGSVYLGFDLKLKRPVAVKMLKEFCLGGSFEKRFMRESESMAKMNHPNIVTVFDCGEHMACPYLVMEFVNGPSLRELINKTTLTLQQICTFAFQVCSAMAYAHSQKIIHRDLTLKNIMVDKVGEESAQVKIMDFGLAKLLDEDAHTSGKAMMGTPYYMSPEQVRGEPVDERADIFSFGVGMFRLVNGRFPFEAEHPTALMYLIVNETSIQFADGVPEDLKNILLRCLEKDPRNRPRDFSELAKEFEMLLKSYATMEKSTSVSISSVGELTDRSSKRNPYLNRVMIKNPSDFFGRQREIRKIYSRLDAPHPQSISIVGDRRIGKSSLLNYIYHKRNRKQHMQNYSSSIFVYLDFQRDVDFDVSKFIDFLFNVFSYEIKDGGEYASREKSLDQLKQVVQSIHEAGKRIIVLMDEFESITRNEKFGEEFFSFLRSLANSFRVAYVTSSFEELQLMCHNKDISDSPFFNIFSNLPLRPFSREEALELITVPSKTESVPLEPYANKIIEIAGNFPFYLQVTCSSVFEYLVDNPDSEPDWSQISKTMMDELLPHYSFVWDRMEDVEKDNLGRIANAKPINKKFHYVNEELVRRGYLHESNGELAVCSSSFKDFVLQEMERSGEKKSVFSAIFGKRGKGK